MNLSKTKSETPYLSSPSKSFSNLKPLLYNFSLERPVNFEEFDQVHSILCKNSEACSENKTYSRVTQTTLCSLICFNVDYVYAYTL